MGLLKNAFCALCLQTNQNQPDPRSLSSPDVSISVSVGRWEEESPSNQSGYVGSCKPDLHIFCLFNIHQQDELLNGLRGNLWGPSTEASERSHQITLLWVLPFSGLCNHHTSAAWRKSPRAESSAEKQGTLPLRISGVTRSQALSEPSCLSGQRPFCPEATARGWKLNIIQLMQSISSAPR